ncbi:MAG: hypothetical protein WC581_13260 [Thermodesulfovibrionales bacterium]
MLNIADVVTPKFRATSASVIPKSSIRIQAARPECGGAIEHEGGCAVCHNCGFTKCG